MRTLGIFVATGFVTLSWLTTSASADKVRQFKFAHDAADAMSHIGGAARPSDTESRPGVPGFYDPTTRTFAPLASRPQGSTDVYTGQVVATIHVNTGSYIKSTDTVFCSLYVIFGNVVGTPPQLFADHYVESNSTFPASQKSTVLTIDYSDVPNGTGVAKMRSAVSCKASNHSALAFTSAQKTVSGSVPVSFDLGL